MGDFPVAMGCWAEKVVIRECVDLSGVEEWRQCGEEGLPGRAAGWRVEGTRDRSYPLGSSRRLAGQASRTKYSGYALSKCPTSSLRQVQPCAVYTRIISLSRRVAGTCSCSQCER